jgi:hypothetical protein
MKIRYWKTAGALISTLLCAATLPAHAQEQVTETISTVPFMVGGIGKDEVKLMREVGKRFNLRMEFSATKDNEFLANVALLITNMQGTPVFAMPHVGPIVNVNLPEGEYKVVASHKSNTETRTVKVQRGKGQDLFFHWASAGEAATKAP